MWCLVWKIGTDVFPKNKYLVTLGIPSYQQKKSDVSSSFFITKGGVKTQKIAANTRKPKITNNLLRISNEVALIPQNIFIKIPVLEPLLLAQMTRLLPRLC